MTQRRFRDHYELVGFFLKRLKDGLILNLLFQAAKRPSILRNESKYNSGILRKEVIQPQVPLRLPCYDFTPVTDLTVACCLLAVGTQSSGKTNSHGVTGGVYKARERIHRVMLLRDY